MYLRTYFLNDTLIANVALNVPKDKIDFTRINYCIKAAELDHFLESQVDGLNTIITENGKNLVEAKNKELESHELYIVIVSF